jgi:hypothetical protein
LDTTGISTVDFAGGVTNLDGGMKMELLTTMAENWQEIAAGLIIAVAAAGKVFELCIKTAGNVRDTYIETFGPKGWK